MPCCTLIAFVLGQLGLGAGAARVQSLGNLALLLGKWKAFGLASAVAIEIVLFAAALPYVITPYGREEVSASFGHAWRICSVKLDALTAR